MSDSILFYKIQCSDMALFVCKDSGLILSKELGFHKSSPDYSVKWVEMDGKWSLFVTNCNYKTFNCTQSNCIVTVDTLFDVFDYICKNKHMES